MELLQRAVPPYSSVGGSLSDGGVGSALQCLRGDLNYWLFTTVILGSGVESVIHITALDNV